MAHATHSYYAKTIVIKSMHETDIASDAAPADPVIFLNTVLSLMNCGNIIWQPHVTIKVIPTRVNTTSKTQKTQANILQNESADIQSCVDDSRHIRDAMRLEEMVGICTVYSSVLGQLTH